MLAATHSLKDFKFVERKQVAAAGEPKRTITAKTGMLLSIDNHSINCRNFKAICGLNTTGRLDKLHKKRQGQADRCQRDPRGNGGAAQQPDRRVSIEEAEVSTSTITRHIAPLQGDGSQAKKWFRDGDEGGPKNESTLWRKLIPTQDATISSNGTLMHRKCEFD